MVEALSKSASGPYDDPRDDEIFIQLGFAEKPRNKLITKAMFTPSKMGGDPAWIAPPIPEDKLIC